MPGNPNTGEMGAGEPIVNSKSSSTTQQTLPAQGAGDRASKQKQNPKTYGASCM